MFQRDKATSIRFRAKMSATSAIYDRQIRLWGLETQSKISTSKVLLYGYHSGLLEELAKDLVLTGIGTLVIGEYSGETLGKPTLVTYLGQDLEELVKALRILNPNAQIHTMDSYIEENLPGRFEKGNDVQTLSRLVETKAFGIFGLIGEKVGSPIALSLDRICRDNNTLFAYVETVGALGFLILDLGSNYTYRSMNKSHPSSKARNIANNKSRVITLDDSDEENEQKSQPSFVENTLFYPTLEEVFSSILSQRSSQKYLIFLTFMRQYNEQCHANSHPDVQEIQKQLEMFLQLHNIVTRHSELQSLYNFCSFMNVEMISVSSCLAGILGREIVKLISRNEKPIFNTFIFDAFACTGSIVQVASRVDRKRSRQDEADSIVYDI